MPDQPQPQPKAETGTGLSPVTIIPARMASARLPGKPLAEIGGVPMIVLAVQCAVDAGIGPVVVATPDGAVMQAVTAAGGKAVPTPKDFPSGLDRAGWALGRIDKERAYDTVIVLPCDLPSLDPDCLRMAVAARLAGGDVGAVVGNRSDDPALAGSGGVHAALDFPEGQRLARALYFSTEPVPGGDGPRYRHAGVSAYTRKALEALCRRAPGGLERREGIPELRALEAGLSVMAARVDRVPLAVDTPADLERARETLAPDTA